MPSIPSPSRKKLRQCVFSSKSCLNLTWRDSQRSQLKKQRTLFTLEPESYFLPCQEPLYILTAFIQISGLKVHGEVSGAQKVLPNMSKPRPGESYDSDSTRKTPYGRRVWKASARRFSAGWLTVRGAGMDMSPIRMGFNPERGSWSLTLRMLSAERL